MHVKMHDQDNLITCDDCNRVFVEKKQFEKHLASEEHVRAEEKRVSQSNINAEQTPVSTIAKQSSSNSNQTTNAIKNTLPRMQTPVIRIERCDSMQLPVMQTAVIRIERCDSMPRGNRETSYVCVECGDAFSSSASMDDHMEWCLNCDHCNKHFDSKEDLNSHLKIHRSTGNCGLDNDFQRALEHDEDKQFGCGTCSKAFSTADSAKACFSSHTKAAFQLLVESDTKWFGCGICCHQYLFPDLAVDCFNRHSLKMS